jgi:hypothetical protein
MPIFERDDVQLYYEEHGAGFPIWLFAIIEADLKSFHTRLICAFVGCVHFADQTPSVGST